MKLLIISHNPITTYHNMGKTMLSLFESFKKEELCQLYIYPNYPDIDFCKSYYRITDKDIAKSFFTFKNHGRKVEKVKIKKQCGMFEKASDESFYKNPKNKKPVRRLLRDLMWKCSKWFTKSLEQWLQKESPDCIFVAPGDAMFIYDIAFKISSKLNIPLISYVCDDYYFAEYGKGFIEQLRVKLLKRKIAAAMKKTKMLIAISEEIKNFYEERFGVSSLLVMTGADEFTNERKTTDNPLVLSYFGNLRCNRYVSLSHIGQAIDKLNETDGKKRVLKIYSAEKDKDIIKTLSEIKSVELCGFVTGENFRKAIGEADVLLHTEAFDKENRSLVKHSVSTKIADSLKSGIPLLAYGPAEISSMKHLIKNNCAAVATEKEQLQRVIRKALEDESFRKSCVKKALETAEKYHNKKKNSRMIYKTVENVILGKE